MNNRIDSCNEIAGAAPVGIKGGVCRDEYKGKPEPVGEEVEVVGYRHRFANQYSSPVITHHDYPPVIPLAEWYEPEQLMTVTQHQRLLEEAKHGQRVLAMEVEQLEFDMRLLRDDDLKNQALRQQESEIKQLKAEVERLTVQVGAGHKLAMDAACAEIELLREERDQLRAEVEMLKSLTEHALDLAQHHGTERDAVRAQLAQKAAPVGERVKAEHGDYPVIKWAGGYTAEIGSKLFTGAQTVVLPDRMGNSKYHDAYILGWNACLDEVARLNQGAKP